MTYLGFYDVRSFAPASVDLVMSAEIHAAIIEVGKSVLETLRNEKDYETAAEVMMFEGEWFMWHNHRSVELELKRHANSKEVIAKILPWFC